MAGNYGFAWSRGGSRAVVHRAATKRTKLNRFAQALADGETGSITEAARAAGISQQTGSIYFREICAAINAAQRAAGYGDWAI